MNISKQKLLVILLMLLISWNKIAQAQSYQTAEVNYAGSSEPGTILLRVVGYGSKTAAILEEAQTKAFQTLLFRGLPGSQQVKPLIENETSSRATFTAFWEEFFLQKRYKVFLMQASPTSKARKKHGQRQATSIIKINIDALRKDLEQNGLVRKFGI